MSDSSTLRRRYSAIPTQFRGVFARAAAGNSRASAIKAMCVFCMGYSRAEVERCTAKECPLWPYRPYQRPDEQDDEIPAAEGPDFSAVGVQSEKPSSGSTAPTAPRKPFGRPFQKRQP